MLLYLNVYKIISYLKIFWKYTEKYIFKSAIKVIDIVIDKCDKWLKFWVDI